MSSSPSVAGGASSKPTRIAGLPRPAGFPDGLPARPRVLALLDGDAVSHGLVDGTPAERASDEQLGGCLRLVRSTAAALGPVTQVRCAASTKTARTHLSVVVASPANEWVFARGLGGADRFLLEELGSLAEQPSPHRQGRPRRADVVILVALDHAYAPAVRRLRLLGVPTWLLTPSRFVAGALYAAATAVTSLPRTLPA